MVQQLINNITKDLNKKIEDIIKEGLKRKGYEFADDTDLLIFIKKNCRCEEIKLISANQKEKRYYVKDIPFLLFRTESENNIMSSLIDSNGTLKVSANYGYYKYL